MMMLLRTWLAAVLVSLTCANAFAQENVRELIDDLRSPDRPTRHDAAEALSKPRHPNIHAVLPLLAAAKIETHIDALGAMLRGLGKSGMREVLGFIQTHAQSPIPKLQKEGRDALKAWLVTNGVMSEDAELPDPPHSYYQEPPMLPPDRAAGTPIAVWAGEAPSVDENGVPYRPGYEEAHPDGVPAGMRIGGKPKWNLVIAGISVFGGLYLLTNVATGIEASSDDKDYDGRLLIPIVGPLFPAAELFEDTGFLSGLSHIAGVVLVIDTLGQLAGVVLAIAGGATTNPTLERTNEIGVKLSPSGLALTGSF